MNEIIPGCGFHHLALRCADFERSVKFYSDLGFRLRLQWGEGDKTIAMYDTGNGDCMELFAGGAAEQPTGMFWHVAFRTTDTDKAFDAAVAAGAAVDKPPFDAVLQGKTDKIEARIAFVKGPDGETLEFFCEK